jgi:hypothetical protein
MNRNIGLSAGVLAVIVFMTRSLVPTGQVNGPAEASKTSGKQAEISKKAAAEARQKEPPPNADFLEGPWIATRQFYGPTYEPVPPKGFSSVDDLSALKKVQDCAVNSGCQRGLADFFGLEDTGEVSFLLATVPDPLHSRLSLFTDSSIQAIEAAATDAGWRFATQWMPWGDNVNPDEKDPEVRRQQRADMRNQEKQPGVLVFRSPHGAQVLWIFLVGETPTAGINPAQFQLALAYMDAINKPNEVRVQGPTFSGSFPSLTKLLLDEKNKKQSVRRSYRIRSGTVTSAGLGFSFQKQFPDFRGATANSDDQAKYFRQALDDMGIPRENAALLAEDESDAGESAVKADPDIKVFRFPRDISHLRNAYREAVQSSSSGKTPAPDIDFSLKDSTTGEDSIPIYSATQSPLSQNGVINEITSAIQREGIRIVRINATNVLDLLFLAQVLKQRCPDTRLMVSFPDVLFIQAAQTGKLAGTLALSSYPMFDANNTWMGPPQDQHPQFFSDANSEGVYNATTLLLSDYRDFDCGPYRANDEQLPSNYTLADYHWKALEHPPTWVLMLDRQGLLPVNVLPHTAEYEKSEAWFQRVPAPGRYSQAQLPPPSGLWRFVSTTAALAAVLISIWIFALELFPTWQVDARFTLTEIESEAGGRPFFLFLFLMLLVSILVVMWSPLWPPNHGFSWFLFLPGLVAGMLLVCPALYLFWRGFCPGRRGVSMLFCLLPLTGALGLWLNSCFSGSDRSLFFSLRAIELHLASSPTWPILTGAGALLVWAFFHLTRFYQAAALRPDVLTTGIETGLQPLLNKSVEDFDSSINSITGLWKPKQQRSFWLLFVLGGLLCWIGRIDVKLSSVEGAPYDWLVLGVQLFVALTLLCGCWQATYLWRSLQSLLSCLGLLPLATSFIRTDHSASDRPIWARRLTFQSIDVHASSMAVLHDAALLRKSDKELSDWMRSYNEDLTNDLLKVDPERTRAEAWACARKMRRSRRDIAQGMFARVREQWIGNLVAPRMPGPALPSAELPPFPPPPKDDKFADLAQTFLALHFSPFILYAIGQIRNLILFLSIGFVLLMFSVSSYSFQAPQVIGRLLLALFAVIAWVVWTCLSGIELDPIVSHISGSDPGKLNMDFYFRLISVGALPILGLLASQFPSIANFLLSSVEPALAALR